MHPEPGRVPLHQPVKRRGVERADRIAAPPRRHRERARRVVGDDDRALPCALRLLEFALDEPQVRHMPLDAPGRGEVLSVRPAMGGSTMSFLLDWNPGIGDRERGAQPLVEFSRRLSAVPSAPGERACFVFGAGRDHQAQSGLGCSTFQCFRSGESVVTGTSPVGVPPARPRFGDRLHASHGPCPSVLCAASLRIRTGGLADVLSASGASWFPCSFSSSSSPFGRSSCCTGSPPPITLRGGPQRGLYGEVLGEGSFAPPSRCAGP